MTTEQYEVRNRWTREVQFTAEISVTPDMMPSIKLGLAVKWAVKNKANLSGANLSGADLSRAIGAELAIAKTRILPEGDIIGWKKCEDEIIVRLRIPADSPRSHAFGRKCRAQFADVLEIFGADHAVSKHDSTFIYRAGERVEAANWSTDWQDECAGGVHFFITQTEAEAY